jgi:hypothetical protein
MSAAGGCSKIISSVQQRCWKWFSSVFPKCQTLKQTCHPYLVRAHKHDDLLELKQRTIDGFVPPKPVLHAASTHFRLNMFYRQSQQHVVLEFELTPKPLYLGREVKCFVIIFPKWLVGPEQKDNFKLKTFDW